jgi:hypothetical protein
MAPPQELPMPMLPIACGLVGKITSATWGVWTEIEQKNLLLPMSPLVVRLAARTHARIKKYDLVVFM